tara:strand:- start:99104 stop:100021 length:918 start_codon:yes stop_codon:yes gene_type:complete
MQIHLWSGISIGLYIFFISITGSVLVYRNELYVAATPNPVTVKSSAPLLSDERLVEEAILSYPDSRLNRINRSGDPDRAVEVWLNYEGEIVKRFFDPRTGMDIGSADRTGQMLVIGLIELHESFLAGPTGRTINGLGAIAILLLVCTGIIIWWPGSKRWRRSLMLKTNVGWKRFIWDIHSMVGFWSFGFIVVFAFSGIYLCFPNFFHDLADKIQPITAENAGERFVDKVLYWLAFLHFGRINGIGISCSGPGLCDQSVKAIWALFGLAPAVMFVTGSTMWWNRVVKRWRRTSAKNNRSARQETVQ